MAGGPVLPRLRAVLIGFAGTLDLPGCAAMLTMLVQGLQVVAKADPDPRRLVRGVDVALLSLARDVNETTRT
jgi:hypothetical protein